ncbi:MAG: hypothetical protein DCE90_18435 [Pseudanabaena sp.]|nr:MAG: hypothetical protein DCE90_18435 [Pseudanabaena sp.]
MRIYSNIKACKTGLSIDANDERQILMALNLKNYSSRKTAKSQVMEDLPEIARREREDLITALEQLTLEERKTRQYPASEHMYCDNCHTLTRIAKSQFNWQVVYGYAFSKKSSVGTNLVLRHHSVSKDNSGNLIELTACFNVADYEFIEHQSALNFIDLQAFH